MKNLLFKMHESGAHTECIKFDGKKAGVKCTERGEREKTKYRTPKKWDTPEEEHGHVLCTKYVR